jgi:hypothetical protein
MALLLLTMITSALFYKPEDNETGASTSKNNHHVSVVEFGTVDNETATGIGPRRAVG